MNTEKQSPRYLETLAPYNLPSPSLEQMVLSAYEYFPVAPTLLLNDFTDWFQALEPFGLTITPGELMVTWLQNVKLFSNFSKWEIASLRKRLCGIIDSSDPQAYASASELYHNNPNSIVAFKPLIIEADFDRASLITHLNLLIERGIRINRPKIAAKVGNRDGSEGAIPERQFPSKKHGFPVNEHGRIEETHHFIYGHEPLKGNPDHTYNLSRNPITCRYDGPQLIHQTLVSIKFKARTQLPLDKLSEQLKKLKERYEAEGYINIRWEVDFEFDNQHNLIGDRLETEEERKARLVYEKVLSKVNSEEHRRLQKKYLSAKPKHHKELFILEEEIERYKEETDPFEEAATC